MDGGDNYLERVSQMPEAVATLLIAFLGAVVTAIGWFFKLEGKTAQISRDLARLEADHKDLSGKHDSLDQKIMEKFSDVQEALARIEERLKSRQERNEAKN